MITEYTVYMKHTQTIHVKAEDAQEYLTPEEANGFKDLDDFNRWVGGV